ncbi:protein translocase subunit SecF [Candidatus Roizmanbacteria bacterium]|nr:protein translocase subunit SecF [Candidatus Roizmanbacteria bacterium]
MVNFLKYRWLYILISSAVIGIGIFSMIKWGFRLSIDFIGGSNLEYSLRQKGDVSKVKEVLKKNKVEILQMTQKDRELFVKAKSLNEKQDAKLNSDLKGALGPYITILRSETVSPILGKEMINKTIIASILAIIGILLYMSFTFKSFYFALSAIIALVHDFLVVVGAYSLFSHFFGAEVDLLFVTALLTTMSFSVHDTIVIFDKIREYGKAKKAEG